MLTFKTIAFTMLLKTITYTGFPVEIPSIMQLEPTGEQQRIYTPISEDELLNVLRESHVMFFGEEPSEKRLAMAWAQVAFENGRGKFVWNNNLGNTVPVSSTNAYYVTDSGVKYRSFMTLEDSGVSYWSTLTSCKDLLNVFDDGDPQHATIMLKSCGYFEAEVSDYAPPFRQLYSQMLKEMKNGRGSNRSIHW